MSKNVLITGGAGFIAHHVIDKILRETDWNIVCLDRLDISGNLNRLHDMLQDHDSATIADRLRIVFHDLKAELNLLLGLNMDDDYWTSTSGQPDYIPDRNEFEEDYRWFYQVRMQDEPYSGNTQRNINKGFLCHASYYGNVLPVKDI